MADPIADALGGVSTSLTTVSVALEHVQGELVEQRKENQQTGAAVRRQEQQLRWTKWAVILTGVVLAMGGLAIYLQQRSNRRMAQQIADCTIAPTKPAPAGTPLNKMSCYERSQSQTGAAINQIVLGFDADIKQRLMEILDAARTGKPLIFGPAPTVPPPTTTTVPPSTSRIGAGTTVPKARP